MLKEGDRKNFETLRRALANGDALLVESRDQATGEYVALVCAAQQRDGKMEFVPLAEMVRRNPYEMYADPTAEELPAPRAQKSDPEQGMGLLKRRSKD